MNQIFEQDVICKKCKKLLGYAPYYRTDYLCKKCNIEELDPRFQKLKPLKNEFEIELMRILRLSSGDGRKLVVSDEINELMSEGLLKRKNTILSLLTQKGWIVSRRYVEAGMIKLTPEVVEYLNEEVKNGKS